MYLAHTKSGKFFDVPRDYEKWSSYEQMLEWSQRAARSSDEFRLVARRIDRLPDGSTKRAFQQRLGTRGDRRSPMGLYDWVWHHAADPNPHVFGHQQATDCVERLEEITAKLKKDMKSQGLGDVEPSKLRNPWIWIGIGSVGVVGLGYVLFAKKKKR